METDFNYLIKTFEIELKDVELEEDFQEIFG